MLSATHREEAMLSSIEKEIIIIIHHRRILLGVVATAAIIPLIFLASGTQPDEPLPFSNGLRGLDQNAEMQGVKCCSHEKIGRGWLKTPSGPEWCPFTYDTRKEKNCAPATFQEATNFCAAKGGRICTAHELESSCTSTEGERCEYVWGYDNGGIDHLLQPAVVRLPLLSDNESTIAPLLSDNESTATAAINTGPDDVARPMGDALSDTAPSIEDVPSEAENVSSRPLVHVFSPYHDPSAETFAPLNVEQWTMLVSAKSSQERFHTSLGSNGKHDLPILENPPFDHVILVCAVLKMDEEILKDILSLYCDHVVVLARSTAEVYTNLKPLPFVQDIVDAGRSVMNKDDDYYLMLTNADICPSGFFYHLAQTSIQESTAISINRMTIPKPHLTLPNKTDGPIDVKHDIAFNIMQQARIALNHHGQVNGAIAHPGQDCFLFHPSLLDEISFGDLFLGYPRWAGAVDLMMRIVAINYHNFQSNKLGTFHLGDERPWQQESVITNSTESEITTSTDMSFWKDFDPEELKYLVYCPVVIHPPRGVHTLQNVINCGKLFVPRNSDDGVVPAFVQPGYEDVYMKTNSASDVLISKDGFPEATYIWQGSTSKMRRAWIASWG